MALSSTELFRVKAIAEARRDVNDVSDAFSDVSACSDTDQYRVNERPRYGPEWEAQKAAFKEKKRQQKAREEEERQRQIREAIRLREEEQKRRLEAGEVDTESDTGLDDISSDEEEDIQPPPNASRKLFKKSYSKDSNESISTTADDLPDSTVLAHGSALAAVRCLKMA
mmetsp:Transcript_96953/g.230583  ORF Transcript_96953/g.230583 Transcript_96953/m.230583 type:complete len:169 (+) Transcript_96953:77-583(+)|eukprot:CAMPEP_0181533892 /NCGR_PEP_ID=MMETSP1110-20121109/73411_1 /TAXON_ID=174948 /ORGANISM="Symbiodinium sp., Strain CCMP421" /LENGTH=168 /DNA_ID=CAMNT_0023665129 /DNA_START=76 /DNA_END=582 /DNA_ORIENTATION=-